jgi:hypothetical protein
VTLHPFPAAYPTEPHSLLVKEFLCLQEARNLISSLGNTKRGGKPPAGNARKAKRTLSAEAREKIAAAQRNGGLSTKSPQ